MSIKNRIEKLEKAAGIGVEKLVLNIRRYNMPEPALGWRVNDSGALIIRVALYSKEQMQKGEKNE